MEEYEFTLKFDVSRVVTGPEDSVERLGEHGCDDAIVGVGIPGRIALMFSRLAGSAEEAVMSALADVESALPGARLVEATPDYVGITEVAEITGKSRQYLRRILLECKTGAPLPVHEGSTSMWHLAPVLSWLRDSKSYRIEQSLFDVAAANMELNAASTRIPVRETIRRDVDSYLAEA